MSNRLQETLRKIRGSKGRRRAPITLAYAGEDPDALRNLAETKLSHSAVVVPVKVQDPMESDKEIVVFRSVRDDLLGELYSKSVIHSDHYRAGREWQKAFEGAGGAGVSAIDTTREAVDGGGMRDPITETQMRATEKLGRLNAVLMREQGQRGYQMIFNVLGRGVRLDTMLEVYGMSDTRRTRGYVHDKLRECLETLMEELGYVVRRKR